MRHTPKPWRLHRSTVKAGDVHVANILVGWGVPLEEAKANAHLIVAAPEMLAALQETMTAACDRDRECDRGSSPPEHSARCRRAYAAIAKAEGREVSK